MTPSIESTLNEILKRRVSAILRTNDTELGRQAMTAAVAGGFRMIEFTLTIPRALDLVREFSKQEDLLVGAGTVLTPEDVSSAVAAGARFIVSPVTDPAVIRTALEAGSVPIPGAFTPTEMLHAHRAGAPIVKLFPAPHDVAGFVTALRGPMPFLKIFPTAGVTADNFLAVLAAGAAGVGFVASLFDPRDMAEKNFTAIQRRAEVIHERLVASASRAE